MTSCSIRITTMLAVCAVAGFGQSGDGVTRAVTDPGVITTGQAITPAGVQSVFEGRVYGLTFGETVEELWVLRSGAAVALDWKGNRVAHQVRFSGAAGLQGIRYDRGRGQILVSLAANRRGGRPTVRLIGIKGDRSELLADNLGEEIAGALASNGKIAAVPLINNNGLAIVELATHRVLRTIPTEIAPFGAVLSRDGKTAYVSNWGGRLPDKGDVTLPTGLAADADQVVVDEHGIAATGTVTRIDVASGKTARLKVGLHPTAMVWDETHRRLFVANANDDTVSVIDTKNDRVVRTLELQPFKRPVKGIAPTALALSPEGSTLYVACGGINAIAVVDTADGEIRGLIPTAWYPNGIAVSPDGKHIAVSALLGVGSGWRGGTPRHRDLYGKGEDWGDSRDRRFVHSYRGSVSVIPAPDAAQLAGYTTAVAENNRVTLLAEQAVRRAGAGVRATAVPRRAGDPSLIEYVVYIIKENRTYDQVLGDLSQGNGDPSLALFGAAVTPNQHRLAEQFVLLDNFYATGGNSGDGHQWVTQANETAYCLWPGYRGRSYPYDGTDPIAPAKSGFIWDLALQMNKTVRVFGEYAGRLSLPDEKRFELLERWKQGEDFTGEFHTEAPLKPLNKILAKNYPPFSTSIPDVVRARIFLAAFKKWSAAGEMPNLVIVQLPSNHTKGTHPGSHTPKAMVADNDLALGQIVEALSHSEFWKKMAILVVEDDAQNGIDHVDGHRTVALAVSPYARRGYVDSTFYSQPSMLKTMELMLGLPTMSLFDLIANDMRASFVNEPNLAPYKAVQPEQDLFERNPKLKALRGKARQAAVESSRMRFDIPDAAPTERLNRIIWHQIRGWDAPYPAVRQAVFAPLSIDIDDDDRERVEE